MRRAIVHVGLPRTGTTTLQRVLFGIRPQLLANGILYPDLTPHAATDLHLSHQFLGEALDGRRPRRDRTELLSMLATQLEATDADVVVLSYEGLCLASPWLGVPRRLAALFGRHGFAIEVLVTVKPQAELVNSAYTWRTQFLREARPFAAFFQDEIGHARYDLGRLLRPWLAACQGRIAVIPTRDARSGRPLVERIFDELGILPRVGPLIGVGELALVQNRSPGPVVVEVARRLRQCGAHLTLRRAARDATRFAEDMAEARGVNAVPFMGLDDALRAAAATRWAQPNDRFAHSIWGVPWSARVAAAADIPSNEIARWGDAAHDVADIFGQTCERFGLRPVSGLGLHLRDAASALGTFAGRAARYGRAIGS